jgi:hypothetical protein
MTFEKSLDQALNVLQRRGRVTYSALSGIYNTRAKYQWNGSPHSISSSSSPEVCVLCALPGASIAIPLLAAATFVYPLRHVWNTGTRHGRGDMQ